MTAPPGLRTSSGLLASSLEAAKASVVRWLERDRAHGHHDLPDAKIASVAGVATLAVNDTMAALYRAGVRSGRVALALASGAAVADGHEACACPHCGRDITVP